MRRYSLLLVLLGMLFGFLYAESDVERFFLGILDAREYHLNLSMSTEANRLYANAQFSVDSSRLPAADYLCFFFNKKYLLERVKINGKSVPFAYATDLEADHFQPPLDREELLGKDAPAYCIAIEKQYFQAESGENQIYLEYRSFLPRWQEGKDGVAFIQWDTEDFIYPKNVMNSATVNLEFSCIPYFEMEAADTVKDVGNIRRIKRSFRDAPQRSSFIKIIKS